MTWKRGLAGSARIRGLSAFWPRAGEMRELVALALPVAVVQMGLVAQGLVDTAMVGRVTAADLGAVTLGNLYFFGVAVFGMGLLLALDPIVSQAFGAEDDDRIQVAVQRGIVLSVCLAVAVSLLLALAGPVLTLLRQPADVVPVAARYAGALIPGMLPFYAFIVFRQVLQSVGRVAPIVWTIVLANGINAFANWVLIWGHLGSPAFGAVGSGWATAISRWFMCASVLGLGLPLLAPYLRRVRRETFRLRPLLQMIRIGSPIGLHMFLEFGAFGAIGIAMGWMGTEALAGHQVALNLAAFAFMLPVGISQASAVLVGQAVGRSDPDGARRSGGGAIVVCCAVMAVTAGVFLGLPGPLARLFSTEGAVVAVAATLLPVAGVFQLFDGLQIVCAGALRGVADTLRPMLYNLLGFWLFGMPISLWLGFTLDWGPVGLWWGLAGGLGLVAILLLGRFWIRFHGALSRLAT